MSDSQSTVVRLVSVVIGLGLYAGLAILGWGGFQPFFSHPPLIALMVVLLVMSLVALFAGGNISPGVREDRDNRWVIAVLTATGLLSAYLPALSDRKNFWTCDGDTVRWIGVALFAIGLVVRIWPVFVLGDRFSGLVAIQPGHTLVTNGVYSVIRHPSSGPAGQRLRLGPGVSLRGRSATGRDVSSAADCAHQLRRAAAAVAIWR